jgi:hypothetical protein
MATKSNKMGDLCTCSKEGEISEIYGDIKLIMNDVRSIKKTLEGNGKEGLIDKVETNTYYRIRDIERDSLSNRNKDYLWGKGWLMALIIIIVTVLSNIMTAIIINNTV